MSAPETVTITLTNANERLQLAVGDATVAEHTRLQEQAEQVAVLEERQRLARELHDSVTQSLYSVTLYANAAALALSASKGEVAAGYLAELQETDFAPFRALADLPMAMTAHIVLPEIDREWIAEQGSANP